METIHVKSQDFSELVLESDLPVIVDFWAPWCGPCRTIGPMLETLAKKFDGQVKLAKVNVDVEPELAQRYGIQGIPTLLAFAGGEQVGSMVGLARPSDLSKFFESAASANDQDVRRSA
jgi:thioredoxin 1